MSADWTDWKALCAELVLQMDAMDDSRHWDDSLYERAQAALAQPEPQGPTDEELYDYWISTSPEFGCADPVGFARAVLARFGRPAIEPVPVSERLPGAEDLDHEGTCWMFHPVNLHYCLCRPDPSIHTHWLPHHALPVPQQEVE